MTCFLGHNPSHRCLSGVVYSVPLFYGAVLVVIAGVGSSSVKSIVMYALLGFLSLSVGVVGLYGVIKRHLASLQATLIFMGVISAVAFIVATILLSQMFALEPPLLEYDLGPALTFVLTNKIGGGIVVAVIYISSIASCVLSGAVLEFQSELEKKHSSEARRHYNGQLKEGEGGRGGEAETLLPQQQAKEIDLTNEALREQIADIETESDEEPEKEKV